MSKNELALLTTFLTPKSRGGLQLDDELLLFKIGFLLMLRASLQGNLIQGKAQLALKNWKNQFGDQREDSLTSLEEYYLVL